MLNLNLKLLFEKSKIDKRQNQTKRTIRKKEKYDIRTCERRINYTKKKFEKMLGSKLLKNPSKSTVLPNSHFFTKFFFLPVWTANKAKYSLSSHELFHKKSFVLKTIHVTSSYRKNKRFFVKKLMRGYI
jgi:hypothetical protein